MKFIIALILCSFAYGCASIVSGTDSTTYIATDPPKAKCTLHGQDFKRILHTPDSITLPAKAAPITIACEAEGCKPTSVVLDTKADGWIFGNILFGVLTGGIGLAVDGARGAGFKYPPQFFVILEPEEFANVAARDLWYDERANEQNEKLAKQIKTIRARLCKDDKKTCDDEVKKAEKVCDEELAALETRRASAKVAGMTSAIKGTAPAQ